MSNIPENNQAEVKEASGARQKKKVLIFIVCYKAEASIESVLDRIGKNIWTNDDFYTETLIIDDQSPDRTFYTAESYARRHPEWNLPTDSNSPWRGPCHHHRL